ncbi:MAG: hypothetical protein FJ267_08915 [Planctomycetes bacterium]|nr:hypothetical protein [Planctomycetota bacterium]
MSKPPVAEQAASTTSSKVTAPQKRPRIQADPFYWKDVYILSLARRRLNVWSVVYSIIAIAIGVANYYTYDFPDDRPAVFLAEVIAIQLFVFVVISIRFDALLTTEFREKTWGTLMLLPIDPRYMVLMKVVASLREQRMALLPLAISYGSVLITKPESLVYAMMPLVPGAIACGLLCQNSCINQFDIQKWWTSLVSAIMFIGVFALGALIWTASGFWLGYVLTSLITGSIVILIQTTWINRIILQWIER